MKPAITRQIVTIPAACVATALLAGAGCEDASARQRAETRQIITEASRDLEMASLGAWDPGDASAGEQRKRLDAITRTLREVKAEGGQQVAAAMVASAANRELARISLAQAEMLEAQNREVYATLHSNIDAAMRLQGLAEGIEGVSTRELRSALDGERQAAQERLRTYSRRLADLDGPIAERESENQQDAREASRLEDEAIALRRQAAEWGHSAGLATFEQAISLEREADGYEYRIAWRESDLEYDLRPEHDLAGAQVAFLSAMLDDIAETEQSLRARDQLGASEAEATRRLVRSYRDEIAEALDTARARTSGDLQEYYTQAQTHLEQAVKAARTAATKSDRGEADAARLTLVGAHERQGQLFATRARGLGSHAEILDRIIEAGGALGDTTALRRELDVVRAGEAEAMEQARTHMTSAYEQLESVKSRSSQVEVDAFKRGLANTLSSLGAPVADVEPAARETTRRRDNDAPRTAAPTPASTAGGFASPEALVSMFRSTATGDMDAAKRMADAWHATSPAAKRMIAIQDTMARAQEDFMAALTEKFGAPPEGMLAGMGNPAMAALGNMQIVDQNEREATVRTGNGDMMLINVGGSWKIDGDALYGALGPAELDQAETMMGAIPRAMSDLARRIRKGEFRSADQVAKAMMSEMMGAMGGGVGIPGK